MFKLFLAFTCFVANAEIKTHSLKIEESFEIDQLEISGLAWRNFKEKNQELILVGDRRYEFGVLNWNNRNKPGSFQKLKEFKSAQKLKRNSQWEAVASDPSKTLYALQETGKLFAILPDASDVKTTFNLSIPEKFKKELNWAGNSGGEGLVLLKNGNILVLKEKDPVQIVEFSSSFVAVKRWMLSPAQKNIITDASELVMAPNGELFILSDESALIAKIKGLPPHQETFEVSKIWKLPAEISKNAEGMVIDEKNRPVVAVDKRKIRKNIYVLSPINE